MGDQGGDCFSIIRVIKIIRILRVIKIIRIMRVIKITRLMASRVSRLLGC